MSCVRKIGVLVHVQDNNGYMLLQELIKGLTAVAGYRIFRDIDVKQLY